MAARTPGWYEDPSTVGRFRWWDGSAWTRWVASTKNAPFPPPIQGPDERVVPQLSRTDRVKRVFWRGLLALALVLALLTALGMYVHRRDAPTPPDPPASTAVPQTQLRVGHDISADGRLLRLGTAGEVPMPDGDFDEPKKEKADDGLWEHRYSSTAPGSRAGPASQVSAGIASEGVMDASLGVNNAGVAAVEMAERRYGSHSPTIGEARVESFTHQGRPAWRAVIPVSFTLEGSVRHVEVEAVVIQASTRTYVLWVHTPGADASPAQRAAAQASVEGIKITG